MAVIAASAQEYADERGLLTALGRRRSALAARINGIMRRSNRKSSEKNADGKTFNPNRKGYYQYQLDDNNQVYDTYTYYDQNPSNPTETETDAQRAGNDDNFYGYAHDQTNNEHGQYTTGEYISADDNRRPFSGLLSRITNLFGRRQVNIDETRSAELTNLINEQIAIDDHIRYIQSTMQGRGNIDDELSPLQLSRSRIGEIVKPIGRQSTGIFIPLSYLLSQENKNQISSNFNPIYETPKPPGWVVKPIQQVFLPNGLPSSAFKPTGPILVKNIQTPPILDTEIIDVSRPDDESLLLSLKTKLDSIENQIDFIKTHTDPTAGNHPQLLFDLEVQAHDLRNKIKRIEYTLENKISHNFTK